MADGSAIRVEIIDSEAAAGTFSQSESTVEWLDCAETSFLLEYEGGTDRRATPLVPSSCTLNLVQLTNAQGEFMDAIHANRDNRFGVALFIFEPNASADGNGETAFADGNGFWRPIWFGTIMADQGESEHLTTKRLFSITANCGLTLLNDEPFREDDGDVYTDEVSLTKTIARCLEKLPTSSLYGWNQYNGSTTPSSAGLSETYQRTSLSDKPVTPFFRESVWIEERNNHTQTIIGQEVGGMTSVLNNTLIQSMAFVDVKHGNDAMGGTVRERTATSCTEVLENIASIFGAQISLSNGSWFFTNPDVHLSATPASIYHRQFVSFTKTQMLASTNFGPVTNPTDTKALNLFDRGFDLVKGVKQSVLFPVKSVSSIHVEGGSRRLLGTRNPSSLGYNFPGSGDFPGDKIDAVKKVAGVDIGSVLFTNTDCIVPGEQFVTMNGRVSLTRTGVRLGGVGYNYNLDKARGAKYKMALTVKVGNYYLKRSIIERSETAPIKNGVGSTVRTAHFYEQDGDVEWTTDVETYDVIFPRDNSDPAAATVELTSGGNVIDFSFFGGLHTQRRDNNKAEFSSTSGPLGIGTGTITPTTGFDFAWTLPALPSGSDHTGVIVNFGFQLLDSENNVITSSDAHTFYDPDDELSVDDTFTIGRVLDFELLMGDGDNSSDVEFVAIDEDGNTSKIVASETVLGDKYDDTQANRALRVKNYSTDAIEHSRRWVVQDDIDAGKYLHQLLAAETLQRRTKPVVTRTVQIEYTEKNGPRPLGTGRSGLSLSAFTFLHFMRPVKLEYTNGTNEWFNIMELKVTSETMELTMAKLTSSRDLSTITEANDADAVKGPRPHNTITGDLPVSKNAGPPILSLERRIGDTDEDLQNAKDDIASNGTSIATNATAIGTNLTSIQDVENVTAPLTVNAGGTAFTNIALEDNAIRADKLFTSASHRLITDTQLNSIASNALSVSSHTDSIADIEDKTDLLSITEQIDLDAEKGRIDTNVTSIANNVTNISTVTGVANTANNRSVTNQSGVLTNFTNVATNVTNIATNVTNIATNVTAIAGNASDISSLQGDVTDIENALDLAENGEELRTGQSGVELATWTAAGVIDSIADGSTGQFLKTDGSGALSWAAAGGGWHGSTALMKVFPTEFMGNDEGRTLITPIIEDDTANTLGVRVNAASGKLLAINEIPTGYKATHVQVYTDAAVSSGVEVYTFNQTTGAISSVGTGDTNASIDITDVTSTATAAIVIEVSPGSTTRLTFGADITISAT